MLILGGPKFLGRATIEAALAAGHNVTVFNRGQTNPEDYPQIEKVRGDRDGQLDALRGRKWDVVIDDCGYVPRIVRQSAEALRDAVGRYVFVSTISVYKDLDSGGIDEEYPVATLSDESVEVVDGETYGGLKALCEQVVQDVYGERALVIRPGLIVGPHDPTNRFTYWVTRTVRGGEMLTPVGPQYPMQVIDVRDLAEWTLRMAADGAGGVFNATGPDYDLTLGTALAIAREVSKSDAKFVWASEEFLLASKVTPWAEMPLWMTGEVKVHEMSIDRALAKGLTFRRLETTVRDTLAWAQSEPAPNPPPAGMTAEREDELLAAWRAAGAAEGRSEG
ncbi:MAG: NAD-dependent epimerase/dehydratase family protein [Chloroflexota bacterium]